MVQALKRQISRKIIIIQLKAKQKNVYDIDVIDLERVYESCFKGVLMIWRQTSAGMLLLAKDNL